MRKVPAPYNQVMDTTIRGRSGQPLIRLRPTTPSDRRHGRAACARCGEPATVVWGNKPTTYSLCKAHQAEYLDGILSLIDKAPRVPDEVERAWELEFPEPDPASPEMERAAAARESQGHSSSHTHAAAVLLMAYAFGGRLR